MQDTNQQNWLCTTTPLPRRLVLLHPALGAMATWRPSGAAPSATAARPASCGADSGFVFVTDVGEPCDPRNALRALKSAATEAGLTSVGLHTLRHSAASLMLSRGVPITVVSQILGHSGISVTVDVYGHVAPDVSRDAVDALAAALNRAGKASA